MPINIEKKILYIHIPKTAGTYVEMNLNMKHNNFLWSSDDRLLGRTVQHYPFHIILKMIKERNIDLNKYFIFSTIRNPYTRFLSAYNQYPANCNENFKKMIGKRNVKEFAKYLLKRVEKEGYDFLKYGSFHHFEPMYFYLKQYQEKKFNIRILKIEENFDEHFKKIWKKYNFKSNFIRNKINIGSYGKQIKQDMDDELKEIIYKLYKIDYDTFNYN